MKRLAKHSLTTALITAASIVGAVAAPQELVLQSGAEDRIETPIEFTAKELPAGNYSLTAPDGARIPLQVDSDGRATFIEPRLPSGSTKRYRIEPGTASANQVTLTAANDTLTARSGDRQLLVYQMQPGPVPERVPEHFRHGAHLHPVFSPSGKVVTGNHPADHRWHRGIWLAWTKTHFEDRAPDFWNMAKDQGGKLTGEVRFDRLERKWDGPVQAGFHSHHRFVDHTSGTPKDVLNESWEVRVHRPLSGELPAVVFDLTSTQTCAGSVPLELPKYHYGGLGVRGSSAWDPVDRVTMLTSEGDDRKKGDGTKAKWVYLGGEVDGAPAGITILIHPSNFRFPQPLRLNPKNPQLSIAPSADGDWEITPGQPLVSRYRFVITDSRPSAETLERLWQDYANPPKVELR